LGAVLHDPKRAPPAEKDADGRSEKADERRAGGRDREPDPEQRQPDGREDPVAEELARRSVVHPGRDEVAADLVGPPRLADEMPTDPVGRAVDQPADVGLRRFPPRPGEPVALDLRDRRRAPQAGIDDRPGEESGPDAGEWDSD